MIKGKNVAIRHVAKTDLETVFAHTNDMDGRGEYMNTIMRPAGELLRDFEATGLTGKKFEMLVIVDRDHRILGNLIHFPSRPYTTTRELGYRIFETGERGKGYASEAVGLLVDYLFDNFPLNRLEICMDTQNRASERIAQKCGFTHEATLRGQVFYGGTYHDAHLYALVRADWTRAQSPGNPPLLKD
jgi:RimJ/RimL family protein N-acetyltransferase